MVSEMSLITRLSMAIFIAVCILSSSAGSFPCQTCPDNPLQSPEQCNMSRNETDCPKNECFALTAELTNGTRVGMRGCGYASTECSTPTCDNKNKTLSGQVYFRHCVAVCCFESRCNKDLFPSLTGPSSTVHSTLNATVTVSPTEQTMTPTSASIKIKALLYLLVFLLVVLVIMS